MSPGAPLRRLWEIAQRPERVIVGLMSGTSLDGIDAALCRVAGSGRDTRVELLEFTTCPFPEAVRARVRRAMTGTVQDVCEVNVLVGEVLAAAAEQVVEQAGIGWEEVDVIASHGQTLWHVDPSQGGTPSTLQVGEGSVLAERTGRIVVCDFRPRDIAAGGRGAPLVSYVDHCLFAREGAVVALQNIGGIGNVTVVVEDPAGCLAFDTGPGNVLADACCRAITGEPGAFDRDGALSGQGEVIPELLEELLGHPYLELKPPKTTGREVFGDPLAQALIARFPERLHDLLATLVRFTADSIARAYRSYVIPRYGGLSEVIVSGGGASNPRLMAWLENSLRPEGITVRSFDALGLGFSADAKEAVAFAILGNETILGRSGNLPAATGADRPVNLGKIVL